MSEFFQSELVQEELREIEKLQETVFVNFCVQNKADIH